MEGAKHKSCVIAKKTNNMREDTQRKIWQDCQSWRREGQVSRNCIIGQLKSRKGNIRSREDGKHKKDRMEGSVGLTDEDFKGNLARAKSGTNGMDASAFDRLYTMKNLPDNNKNGPSQVNFELHRDGGRRGQQTGQSGGNFM